MRKLFLILALVLALFTAAQTSRKPLIPQKKEAVPMHLQREQLVIEETELKYLHPQSSGVIRIPAGVDSIRPGSIFWRKGVDSISVDTLNRKYDSRGGSNAVIHTETNTLVAGCAATVIPEDVEHIGYMAFRNCVDLYIIQLPNGLKTIAPYAFCACRSLQSVTIPAGVKSIGRYAFAECPRLQTVIITDSLTEIDPDAFCGSPLAVVMYRRNTQEE